MARSGPAAVLVQAAARRAARRLFLRMAGRRLTTLAVLAGLLALGVVALRRVGPLDLRLPAVLLLLGAAVHGTLRLWSCRPSVDRGARALDRVLTGEETISTALTWVQRPGLAASFTRERAAELLAPADLRRALPLWPWTSPVPGGLALAILLGSVALGLVRWVPPYTSPEERQQQALQEFARELAAATGPTGAGDSRGTEAAAGPLDPDALRQLARGLERRLERIEASGAALEQLVRRLEEEGAAELAGALTEPPGSEGGAPAAARLERIRKGLAGAGGGSPEGAIRRVLEELQALEGSRTTQALERIASELRQGDLEGAARAGLELTEAGEPRRRRAAWQALLDLEVARRELSESLATVASASQDPTRAAHGDGAPTGAAAGQRTAGEVHLEPRRDPPASQRALVDRYFRVLARLQQ